MLNVNQLKRDLKKGYDLYFYISNRGGRKSSTVQDLLNEIAIKEKKPYILLRNKVTHKISDRSFSKYIRQKYIALGYDFITKQSEKMRNLIEVYAVKDDEEILLFYGMFVSQSEAYKSNYFDGWENVSAIVWEECIDNAKLLQDLSSENIKSMSKQLNDVISIMSTVTREHKAPLIALGNDIENNIVNAVTANLELLERLQKGVISDKCIINQEEYTFLFDYFQVYNKPMLWLNYKSTDVCSESCDGDIMYQIKTKFNVYTVYKKTGHIYVSQELYSSESHNIETYSDLLKFFKIHEFIDPFELCSLFGKNNLVISKYIKNYQFEPIYDKKADLINFEILKNKAYSEVTTEELKLLQILHKSVVTYSNIAIKYKVQELILMFFKMIIGGKK